LRKGKTAITNWPVEPQALTLDVGIRCTNPC